MRISHGLLAGAVCSAMVVLVSASTKGKDVKKEDKTCHLSGALATRLITAGEGIDRDAEYYLVSLGEVKRQAGKTLLVIKEKYAPGLVSLGDFSHVMVFYWYDKNDTPEKRSFLQGCR